MRKTGRAGALISDRSQFRSKINLHVLDHSVSGPGATLASRNAEAHQPPFQNSLVKFRTETTVHRSMAARVARRVDDYQDLWHEGRGRVSYLRHTRR